MDKTLSRESRTDLVPVIDLTFEEDYQRIAALFSLPSSGPSQQLVAPTLSQHTEGSDYKVRSSSSGTPDYYGSLEPVAGSD